MQSDTQATTIPGKAFVTRPEYPEEQNAQRPLTYLACPYTHYLPEVQEWRYQQATRAAAWLLKRGDGSNVFSPLTHSHPLHVFGGLSGDWGAWSKIDAEYIAVSGSMVVLLLSGWVTSVGVAAEIRLAQNYGIPVQYLLPVEPEKGEYEWILNAPQGVRPYDRPIAQEPHGCQHADSEPGDKANPKDLVGDKKPSVHLVPPALNIWVAKAMENGARKYGPYNWRKNKVRMTVYIAAAQRHLLELLDGEDIAEDSKVHHAAHAAACMGIVLDALETGNLIDDRPTPGCAAKLVERMTVRDAKG